jgi:hypothetical protein
MRPEVDAGEVLVVPGDAGCADGMRRRKAILFDWSSSTIASCGNVEGRLESAAAADVVEELEALRFKTNRRR